jgi:hypothetical protein
MATDYSESGFLCVSSAYPLRASAFKDPASFIDLPAVFHG